MGQMAFRVENRPGLVKMMKVMKLKQKTALFVFVYLLLVPAFAQSQVLRHPIDIDRKQIEKITQALESPRNETKIEAMKDLRSYGGHLNFVGAVMLLEDKQYLNFRTTLKNALASSNHDVRINAISALAEMGGPPSMFNAVERYMKGNAGKDEFCEASLILASKKWQGSFGESSENVLNNCAHSSNPRFSASANQELKKHITELQHLTPDQIQDKQIRQRESDAVWKKQTNIKANMPIFGLILLSSFLAAGVLHLRFSNFSLVRRICNAVWLGPLATHVGFTVATGLKNPSEAAPLFLYPIRFPLFEIPAFIVALLTTLQMVILGECIKSRFKLAYWWVIALVMITGVNFWFCYSIITKSRFVIALG